MIPTHVKHWFGIERQTFRCQACEKSTTEIVTLSSG
jgi:hypothetical protein